MLKLERILPFLEDIFVNALMAKAIDKDFKCDENVKFIIGRFYKKSRVKCKIVAPSLCVEDNNNS